MAGSRVVSMTCFRRPAIRGLLGIGYPSEIRGTNHPFRCQLGGTACRNTTTPRRPHLRSGRDRPAGVRRLGGVLPPRVGPVPAGSGRHGARRIRDGTPANAARRLVRAAGQPGLGAVPGQRPGRRPRAHAPVLRAGRAGIIPRLDPARAAALEVEWWRVHREHQHSADVTEDELTAALVALYSYVYEVPAGTVRSAAELRARAMDVSDRWVAAGCDRDDPLLARGTTAAGRVVHRAARGRRRGLSHRTLDLLRPRSRRPPLASTASAGTTGATSPGSGVE